MSRGGNNGKIIANITIIPVHIEGSIINNGNTSIGGNNGKIKENLTIIEGSG